MNIFFEIEKATDYKGRVVGISAKAVVEHSPREGFDHEELRKLEAELGPYVESRLVDALGKGWDKIHD